MSKHSARATVLGLAVAVALALVPGAAARATAAPPADQVRAVYFADWDVYARGYFVKSIPADRVNTILYAFGMPTADGGCSVIDPWADYQMVYWSGDNAVDGQADAYPDQHLYGNFNQLRKLKAAHPNLRILISLGGWSLSTYFSDVAATAASREHFVASCIDTFIRGDLPTGGWPENAGGPGAAAGIFDGIDVDWEYPGVDPGNGAHTSPADRHNATLLFREFRRQLDELGAATGKHYWLAAALPAGNVHSTGSYELADVARSLDWIDVMTYDFHGVWDAETNFNSPFVGLDPRDPTPAAQKPVWNTAGTVAYYLANGVPRNKIVVGVPFYAKQYIRTTGLYQPFDNTGLDPNTLQWDATPTPTYHDLVDVAKIVTPSSSIGNNAKGLQGFTRSWNPLAGEPWLYNPTFNGGDFITYDDPHSIAERAQLVNALGLRGIFGWEVSQDDDAHDLVTAMTTGPGRP